MIYKLWIRVKQMGILISLGFPEFAKFLKCQEIIRQFYGVSILVKLSNFLLLIVSDFAGMYSVLYFRLNHPIRLTL